MMRLMMIPSVGPRRRGVVYPRGLSSLTACSLAVSSIATVSALCATYAGRPELMSSCIPMVVLGLLGLLTAIRWAGRVSARS